MDFSAANCKNCYKCLRSCSVKAIRIEEDQARIDDQKCIGCGHCFVVCPQNARSILSDLDLVKQLINSGRKVIASIAPSYNGIYENPQEFINKLYKLGFYSIEETAIGAEVVSDHYQELIIENSSSTWITSCCPVVNGFITKYYPSLTKYLLPVESPMIVHSRMIKQKYEGDVDVVFIGPCIAKKQEAIEYGEKDIKGVLTFEEIDHWDEDDDIDNHLHNEKKYKKATIIGKSYPIEKGIIKNLQSINTYKISVTGLEPLKETFEALIKGELQNCIIEASACPGSCLNGPAISKERRKPIIASVRLDKQLREEVSGCAYKQYYMDKTDIIKKFNNEPIDCVKPDTEILKQLLKQMGKNTIKDELNCGACGYDTCQENAIAVYQGMSHVEMCIPNMRIRAERMINTLFKHTPNIVMILDEDLNIVEFNPRAEKVFDKSPKTMDLKPISSLINDEDFLEVQKSKEPLLGKKVYYKQYELHVSLNIIYLENQNLYLTIMHDLTEEDKKHQALTALRENTLETAQHIIDKQMRVAQEIASLLGETTAETKVTLMKLQKLVRSEEGDVR